MRRLSLVVFAAILTGGAASAWAQQPTPAPAPRRPPPPPNSDECTTPEPGRIECRRTMTDGRGEPFGPMKMRMDSAMMKRAALGLQLTPTGSARDTLGVFVAAVTPKGPAENAGIVEGDRIVSINGVDLRVAAGDVDDGYASGLPSHRLSREVEKLTPGARANLRVYSGGRVRDVEVTAGRASDLMKMRFGNMGGEGPGNMMIFRGGMPEGPMPPTAGMQGMERIHMMMPGMEPGMRAMEMIPRMRMMEGEMGRLRPRSLEPGATYRLRSPARVRVYSPSRLKEEKTEKARADSAKAKAKR